MWVFKNPRVMPLHWRRQLGRDMGVVVEDLGARQTIAGARISNLLNTTLLSALVSQDSRLRRLGLG